MDESSYINDGMGISAVLLHKNILLGLRQKYFQHSLVL